ncbi:amino acid ABC transporter substrate-binding protein [Paramagnetospirillum kuznetsovii]|uniref:Amino acid ABC transporter substrate-binding protein n=1 Tax=Paramagnetospirillum kuznetsovii TaxID=2053833 RepID=A0A364NVJ4_9PROT|nr:ABC transporter substrate-binding protein [Paramagnetospirillum kuznetsovii]RAU21104.1 amino acid ABC transporter substrate-binding protein [Paramagnetospirillum kuznetsovii]
MKRIVLAAAVMLSISTAQAAEPGRLERIVKAGEVRVCIWPDYYSISYRNTRTGQLEGIDIDMAKELGKDLKVKVQFVDSSFKTLVDDLLADRCDVSMHGVAITPARQEKLVFTQPHLRSGIYFITTKTHPVVKSYADMDRDGVVVAAAAGTYMVDVMKTELKHATLLEVATPEAREQEVMAGRADLFATDYPYSRKMLARHDWAKLLSPPTPLAPNAYAYAMAPGDAGWLATMDAFVARAKADGRLLAAAKANGLDAIVELK